MPNHSKIFSILLTAVVSGIFFANLPAFATEKPGDVPIEAGVIEHLNNQLNLDIPFKDSSGKDTTMRELMLKGRPMLVTPVYYGCPRLCTAVLNGLLEGLKDTKLKLGRDFNIVSFSFNPKETPEDAYKKSKVYFGELSQPELGPGNWHFLTGTEENISKLTRELGFRFREDKGEFIHPAAIMFLTPEGVISRYLYGIKFLESDLRLAILEAGEGKIGSTLDQILLYCFRFDNTHGRYTLVVMNLVRAISLVVVVVLSGGLMVLRYREIQNRKVLGQKK